MTNFNFGISGDSAIRNSRQQLKPWGIYPVKFMGCEIREFEGKKETNKGVVYKVLDIKFEGEDGVFTLTKFFPKDGDDVRRTTEGKSGTITFPSSFEVLMNTVKQTAQVLSPKGFEKMQAASSKFRSFDDVAKALIAITEPVKGKETNIKLIGYNRDNKVVADIPRIVAINKQGELFIADNYIGDKLFFTDYEETQRSKYLQATPTEMKDTEEETFVAAQEQSEDNFDIDDLAQL